MGKATALFVALAALALAGCEADGGARAVDYTPQRGISSDINASLNSGPTAAHAGVMSEQEPIGVVPWEIGERHQGE